MIGKDNRYKQYIQELEEIEYILDNRRLADIKRTFYENRYKLLTDLINKYLKTGQNENYTF